MLITCIGRVLKSRMALLISSLLTKVVYVALLCLLLSFNLVFAQTVEEFVSIDTVVDCTSDEVRLNFETSVVEDTPYRIGYELNVISEDEITFLNYSGQLDNTSDHPEISTMTYVLPSNSITGNFYIDGTADLYVEATTPGEYDLAEGEMGFEIEYLSLSPCVATEDE